MLRLGVADTWKRATWIGWFMNGNENPNANADKSWIVVKSVLKVQCMFKVVKESSRERDFQILSINSSNQDTWQESPAPKAGARVDTSEIYDARSDVSLLRIMNWFYTTRDYKKKSIIQPLDWIDIIRRIASHQWGWSVYDWKETNWRDWNTCTPRTRLDWMSGSWMGSWKPDLITSVEKTVWSVQLIPFDEAIECPPGIAETDWTKPIEYW